MFALSPYLAARLARHVGFMAENGETWAPPSALFVGLLGPDGTELAPGTSPGYVRHAMPTATVVDEDGSSAFYTDAPLAFNAANAGTTVGGLPDGIAWVYQGVGVYDLVAGGNLLFLYRFPYARYTPFNGVVAFPTGELGFGFAAPAWDGA